MSNEGETRTGGSRVAVVRLWNENDEDDGGLSTRGTLEDKGLDWRDVVAVACWAKERLCGLRIEDATFFGVSNCMRRRRLFRNASANCIREGYRNRCPKSNPCARFTLTH